VENKEDKEDKLAEATQEQLKREQAIPETLLKPAMDQLEVD
jgi:hypothetical protein